ncbi:MAG: single-stranded DNA-binding protein [Candidatus Omnitrophica bacterium]|jgi:single-strand DNA-binding protein|nr:single-stranded DNA-binding protein [Candidatus Omnitrophota bacterium]
MANLNKVLLIGNLTRDPELRYIPSGSAVATFTVAVNRVYKDQAGEKKEQTSFIRIVVWGRRAEVCGEYLSKGSPVFVEGRLQSRDWQTQDGQKRNTVEVIADNIQFLKGAGGKAAKEPATASSADEMETINLNDEHAAQAPGNVKKEASGPQDEEVPF